MRLAKEANNSVTVYWRITKFFTDIHADLVYSHTEYDVSYFWSAFIEVRIKRPKMPPLTALSLELPLNENWFDYDSCIRQNPLIFKLHNILYLYFLHDEYLTAALPLYFLM